MMPKVKKTQSGNLALTKKWDYVQWAGLFIATLLLVLCPFVRCCVPPTVANFIKIVLDLLRLNSIYGCLGFCCLCFEGKMEGVRVRSNTHEIAAGSIFWYNLVWWFECIRSKAITNLRIRLTWYAGRNGGDWEKKSGKDCYSWFLL